MKEKARQIQYTIRGVPRKIDGEEVEIRVTLDTSGLTDFFRGDFNEKFREEAL
jgi:hypothetical protein